VKKVHPELFNEMKRASSNIAAGWLVTRTDGVRKGYTSHDQGFTLEGVYYSPTNSFSGSASVSKNNLSVDNMTVLALVGDDVTDADLRGGVYDNAKVQLFWCRPDRTDWGRMDIQGGTIGEIKIKGLQYEAELRSASQKLQQPFGRIYTTECDTILGADRCGVKLSALPWTPGMTAAASPIDDASIATLVRPTVANGFWYECHSGTASATVDDVGSLPAALQAVLGSFGRLFMNREGKLSNAQGGIVADPTVTLSYGVTGGAEPAWPAALGAIVGDGQVSWKAVRARQLTGTVSGTFNRARFECADLAWVEDRYFQYGLLTWSSGANAGFRMEVRQHRSGTIASFDLLEAMPFAVKVGDTFTVSPGCSRTRAACQAWNNLSNMQGFPDMPTEDKVLATPNYTSQGQQKGSSKK
jgi:hypothetical protein